MVGGLADWISIRPHFATLMTGHQPRQTAFQKALAPALNIGSTAPEQAGYCTHLKPRIQRKNDWGAPGILGSNRPGPNAPGRFSAFRRANHNFLTLHSLTMTDRVSYINGKVPNKILDIPRTAFTRCPASEVSPSSRRMFSRRRSRQCSSCFIPLTTSLVPATPPFRTDADQWATGGSETPERLRTKSSCLS